ncbi:MAG: hypothetical protein PVG98_05420 [Chromatiales bacterium]
MLLVLVTAVGLALATTVAMQISAQAESVPTASAPFGTQPSQPPLG